jgi:hypothetical protein
MNTQLRTDLIRHVIQGGHTFGLASDSELNEIANQKPSEMNSHQLRLLARVADQEAKLLRAEAEALDSKA